MKGCGSRPENGKRSATGYELVKVHEQSRDLQQDVAAAWSAGEANGEK